jgi:hypothetical protein
MVRGVNGIKVGVRVRGRVRFGVRVRLEVSVRVRIGVRIEVGVGGKPFYCGCQTSFFFHVPNKVEKETKH